MTPQAAMCDERGYGNEQARRGGHERLADTAREHIGLRDDASLEHRESPDDARHGTEQAE